jgi:hypothetical protein
MHNQKKNNTKQPKKKNKKKNNNTESLKNAQNDKIENAAGSV